MVFASLYFWNINWLVVRQKDYLQLNRNYNINFSAKIFDDFISYIIISIILGGRIGYVFFIILIITLKNLEEIFLFGKVVCHFTVV